LFLKIGTGDVSSGNMKSVHVFSGDFAVEGAEYEVGLWAELPVISELKAQ
jgi:hypothetical protein